MVAVARPARSLPPPAPNGTIIVTSPRGVNPPPPAEPPPDSAPPQAARDRARTEVVARTAERVRCTGTPRRLGRIGWRGITGAARPWPRAGPRTRAGRRRTARACRGRLAPRTPEER